MVDPSDGNTEPAVGADLLATEAENEVAIGVLAERQAYIHKPDVPVASSMGGLDGSPHGDGIGVEWGEALTARGRIPEVGVAIAEDGDGGTNNTLVVCRNQYLAHATLHHLAEETVIGDIALGFEPVVTTQQFREGVKLVECFYGLGHDATLLGVDDALQLLFVNALLGCSRMQRVVDVHPAYGEESLLA